MAKQLIVGAPAPDGIVRDVQGAEVTISSLWKERPVLLTFLRHFG
ncbi:MAG: hypothetical protein SF162_00885 [bacterium]|nr:hypothetical protein [bacterium]